MTTYATEAVIDLGAIRDNVTGVREKLGPQPRILVAVKANGYGHGAVEVSRMIERTGCGDWLGVATVPEAVELRDAGITLPILKLSHVTADTEARAAVDHDVAVAVVDRASMELMAAAAEAAGHPACVHLKLDTGMRRIGAEPDAAADVAAAIDDRAGVELQGVFTHLPASDTTAESDFTRAQITRFYDAVAAIQHRIERPLDLVHCANSGACLGWLDHIATEARRVGVAPGNQMVRPGILSYGYLPDATTPRTIDLRPALTLRTRVSFVKPVPAGESVGYGRTWTGETDSHVATIPVGYGDGYSRLLSNRGRVLIGGRSYSIAGRVCMDQTMIDLGPETDVHPGDVVTLIGRDGGEEITCDEVAMLMNTITYEVCCLLTPRVTRRYVGQ